jgi:hypothetical protein
MNPLGSTVVWFQVCTASASLIASVTQQVVVELLRV